MDGGEQIEHLFKLLLIGDAGVGKSSILLQFKENTFDENLQSTIGVDFKIKTMSAQGKKIKITIWDTAGQERYRTLTSSYYRGAQGVILVYDVTRRDTYDNLAAWLSEVEHFCASGGRHVVKVLVGNKIDRERRVPREEAEEWARSRGMLFMEASARTRVGIEQVFSEVVQKILENPVLLQNTIPAKPRVALNEAKKDESSGGCC